MKGSLADVRADDLAAEMVRAALDQVPALDPSTVDDVLLGCAQPAGEQGYNLARMVALRLGLDGVPGTTVQRYRASSVQTTRMAMHAIRAGEGHAFISAGAEVVSHYGKGKSDGLPDTHNLLYDAARARSEARGGAGAPPWYDPRADGELPGELGPTPLARIVATGVSALSPEIMGLGPVLASQRALVHAGLSRFGMTGARMTTTTTTIINALWQRDGQFGLVTMCTAGGQGMALIVERLT